MSQNSYKIDQEFHPLSNYIQNLSGIDLNEEREEEPGTVQLYRCP